MKVLLFDIKARSSKKCINKDLAGGMGTGTWVGHSLRGRLFRYVKKKNVVLPVISTAYIVAILKKAEWYVKLVTINDNTDFSVESADLALVPTSIVDCRYELEVVRKLKKNGLRVGVYGTFVSTVPEFFIKDVDFIIKGEPEAGVLKIIKDGKLPKGIFEVGLVRNLDDLPFPDWDQFPIKEYSYSPALNKKPFLPMLSSRGCPYSCSFYCPYPINLGKQWRARSVENIIEEMEYLKKEYGIRAVDFRDPVFSLDRKRTLDFANALIDKEIDIIWSCETRLDRLDKELLKVMYKAGLRNLNVGIESYSSDVLKSSNRLPIEYKHQEEIISFCKKLGITIAAFYILGLEDDTEESINETIEYSKKLNTLVAQFALCTQYPGTKFFEKMKEEGRITTFDWEEYDEYTPVFKHKHLSPEKLLSLKENAFNSYYFRLAYLFKYLPKYIFGKFIW